MLGVFAEFETNLRRERQLEGVAKAKSAGVYKGRPPSIEVSRAREMKAQGMRPGDIAKALPGDGKERPCAGAAIGIK
jgi:DNA invertase Pin-like site-specific DNA recombinase